MSSPFRTEAAAISRLAAPVALANIGWMTLGLVDMWMIGSLGARPLAAVALGDFWIVGTLMIASGTLMGLDPLVAQAHGAGEGARAAHALQRGVLLALALSVPMTALWLLTGAALRAAGQDPELASTAHRYVVVQLFSIAPFLVFVALRQYLQGRAIMRPGLVVVALGNLVNAGLDWVLIFGHFGFPALGVIGSGIATGVARVMMLAALFAITRRYRLHEGAWTPWRRREVLEPRELRRLLALGVPVGIQTGLEIWAFLASGLFAGWLGANALAAHTIVMKMASFSYMVPLGISAAAATRVGNLVGARDLAGARRAAWVAVWCGGGVMLFAAALFVAFRAEIPAIFVGPSQHAVRVIASTLLPIAAAFQLFDGTQAVAGGVLRGIGATRAAAVANLAGYWALALPLSYWLGFRVGSHGWGITGIWIGLAAGLAGVALLLVVWIRKVLSGPVSCT